MGDLEGAVEDAEHLALHVGEAVGDDGEILAQLARPARRDGLGIVAGLEADVEGGDAIVAPGGGVGLTVHEQLTAFVAEVVEDRMNVKMFLAAGRIELDFVAGGPLGAAGEGFADQDVGLRVELSVALDCLDGEVGGQERGDVGAYEERGAAGDVGGDGAVASIL